MKQTESNKPIKTMPDGIWESSPTDHENGGKKDKNTLTTDIQGNGYPVDPKSPKI